ncbi:MAG TPA: hypothetical protein VI413_04060 [Paludibacter sp.]
MSPGHSEVCLSQINLSARHNEVIIQVFISPALKKDNYTLKIEVPGEHPAWTDKSKTIYGSTDDFVVLKDVYELK